MMSDYASVANLAVLEQYPRTDVMSRDDPGILSGFGVRVPDGAPHPKGPQVIDLGAFSTPTGFPARPLGHGRPGKDQGLAAPSGVSPRHAGSRRATAGPTERAVRGRVRERDRARALEIQPGLVVLGHP